MIALQKFTNLIELVTYFKNEQVCRNYLAKIRWDGNITCPYELKKPFLTMGKLMDIHDCLIQAMLVSSDDTVRILEKELNIQRKELGGSKMFTK